MSTMPIIGDRYQLINVLGSGGMGKVYNALDTETGQNVALKIIELPSNRSDQIRKRFMSEVSSLSKLDHPSIVKLLDFGAESSLAYIVMELVNGKPLSRINDRSILLDLVLQVTQAISAIHASNIIHRDIKPENILIVEGEKPRAILVDFGVAKQTDSSLRLTSAGTIIGTISYMSPEQVMGVQIDTRSDLYSLGCVLYEALTGVVPFVAEEVTSQITKILSERPIRPTLLDPTIPPSLEAVVMKLLEKSPERRYKNALELSGALEEVIQKIEPSEKSQFIFQTRANPFVGRITQTKQFEKQLTKAIAGCGSIININGAQGIGKSRMLLEWQSVAIAKGTKFIIVESGTKNPFASLIDQVTGFVTPEIESNSRINENVQLLSGISKKVAERFNVEPPKEEIEQTRLVLAARSFIEAVFEDQTFVIAQDDVKDLSLTSLLKKIAKNIDSKRVIIIDATVQPFDSAFTAIVNPENTINIEPFTLEEVSELARLMHGKPIGYQAVDKIFNASAGNPLYVVELLTDVGRGTTTIETVPGTLRQLFREKMRNLTGKPKLLLEKISILRKSLPIIDLQPIVRMDDETFAQSIQELLSKGLVIERYVDGQMNISISSPVIGQILLEDTLGNDMTRAYNELATSLEIISAGRTTIYDGQIGDFYLMSGQLEKGVKYLFSNAKKLYDTSNEAAFHKEMVKLEPVLPQISDIWLKTRISIMLLASKIMQADIEGINKHVRNLTEMLRKGDIPQDLIKESYLELTYAYMETEQIAEASSAIDQVRLKVPLQELEDDLQYWKLVTTLYINKDEPKLAEKPANMVVMLSYRTGKKKTIANAVNFQAIVSCLNGNFEAAAQQLEQVRQIGSDINDLRLELRALNNLAGVYSESKKFKEAEDTLNQAIAISEKLELNGSVLENLYRLVPIMEKKGDFNGLRLILARMGEALVDNQKSQFYADYLAGIIEMSLSDTDFISAANHIGELIELAMKTNRPVLIRTAMTKKALLYYIQGDFNKALWECERLDDLFRDNKSEDVLVINYTNCFLASRLYAKTGNIKRAEQFLEKGSLLLSTYPEAPVSHQLDKDLARLTLEWIKNVERKTAKTVNILARKQMILSIDDLISQLKTLLEQLDASNLSQKKPLLEVLILFMDIVIWLYNGKSIIQREELNSFAAFASHCTEVCIAYFSSSSTSLFKEDILMRNNKLSQLRRAAS